jgi:hypothetical protein
MTTLNYDDSETLLDARLRYFRANGFGDDGGYNKKWEIIKLGPIPVPIRNIKARQDAIRYHDIHHLVTGYDTNLAGESEIGAWEVATGCGTKWVAWTLNMQAMLLAPRWPGRVLRAWARGRRSQSLYKERFGDFTLAMTVGELREKLELAPVDTRPGAVDVVTLAAWFTAILGAHIALLLAGLRGFWWLVQQLLRV